jgi:hypothetical protein
MDRLRFVKIVVLLVAAVAFSGCKSKQEAPAANGAAPQQNAGAVKSISGKTAAGVVTASPQDKSDVKVAADKVLAQMESGQFADMYKDASAGFKQIGKEADFVAKFQQTRQKVGPLKGQQETSFVTRPDQVHIVIYRMENDRFTTERRLSFARGKSGKMELVGLNQHDEPKQPHGK